MSIVSQQNRIRSIDVARGAVMVLMALDHVRVYSGIPARSTDAVIFLTRWVTNFCAPAFVFLAGCSIFLHGERQPGRLHQSRWLLIHGLWLVFLELTYLRLAWTFNVDFENYMLAGVIWMLGWCMILMALLVHLPVSANAIFGLGIIAGHNLVAWQIGDYRRAMLDGNLGWLWRILYFGGGISVGGREYHFQVLYSILPWIGVIAAGCAFGSVLRRDARSRHQICYAVGASAILAVVAIQCFNVYREPVPADSHEPIWMRFLTREPGVFALARLGHALVGWFAVRESLLRLSCRRSIQPGGRRKRSLRDERHQ